MTVFFSVVITRMKIQMTGGNLSDERLADEWIGVAHMVSTTSALSL
jgi:hypothetical protein